MAITNPTRTTDFGGFLNPELAAPIFAQATQSSVIQQLVPQTPLGANGKAVPVVTGRMSAGWVAEGARKPASNSSLGLKTITPQKIAAIAVVSAEVVRANPGNYITLVRSQIAEAFAIAFDLAAIYDRGPDGTAGGGPFATYINQTTKAVDLGTTTKANGSVWGDLNAGLAALVNDRKKLTGWAFDSYVEPDFNGATDNNGRPLFIDSPLTETNPIVRPGRVMGRPAYLGDGIAEPKGATGTKYGVGFGGDFSQAVWGVVGGITYDVSDQATVTVNGALTSLWENNLVAIRAEAEYGFLVNDASAFVRIQKTA